MTEPVRGAIAGEELAILVDLGAAPAGAVISVDLGRAYTKKLQDVNDPVGPRTSCQALPYIQRFACKAVVKSRSRDRQELTGR